MEEDKDIKILQNLASRTKPIAEDLETAVCSIDEQLAIRNLIARYKEYEEGKDLSKKQLIGVEKAIEQALTKQLPKELEDYILKSKVKEIKEKIHEILDANGITRGYQLIVDGYFDELLEKEEGTK